MSMGTTFNLPNYVAPLFEVGKTSAKFLAAIGGLNNNAFRLVGDVAFGISTFDLNTDDTGTITDVNGTNLEGQDAPTENAFPREGQFNILEMFHEKVSVSYTKMGAQDAVAQYAAAMAGTTAYPASGENAVGNEFDWQVLQHLRKFARKVNYAFVNGTRSFPANNSTARKTGGILSAITTNVVAADAGSGAADSLSQTYLEELVKSIFDNGGLEDENGAVIMCNSTQKIWLDSIYGKAPESVNVGGVMLEKLYTPLGTFGVLLERMMPQSQLAIVSMDAIKPAAMAIPGKGIIFEEPLAKTGASEESQIYGEVGLDYGPESYHGKITNLVTTLPTHA